MVTKEQSKDKLRLKRYVSRNGLSGVLNDTKWNELFELLKPMQGKLSFLRKDVRDSEVSVQTWDGDFYHNFGLCENIEWLCISAQLSIHQGVLLSPKIEDYTEELILLVLKSGIPFSRTEEGVKVWGYIRPGSSPVWVNSYS
jgi:hypothetical protein